MAFTDRDRYDTSNPETDFAALGDNPALPPLDAAAVRHALSMMSNDDLKDRERAVRMLLQRIRDYYQVIGYVGPTITNRSEIGYALGGWIQERGYRPWRESFSLANRYAWSNPERLFHSVRFACFESALTLAAWELGQKVPESQEALKRAVWVARNAIRDHCDRPWREIRNRMGTKGMRKQLDGVIRKLQGYTLIQGNSWLGHFAPVQKGHNRMLGTMAGITPGKSALA